MIVAPQDLLLLLPLACHRGARQSNGCRTNLPWSGSYLAQGLQPGHQCSGHRQDSVSCAGSAGRRTEPECGKQDRREPNSRTPPALSTYPSPPPHALSRSCLRAAMDASFLECCPTRTSAIRASTTRGRQATDFQSATTRRRRLMVNTGCY